MTRYLSAAAHPWASLVFLLPLLIVYEGGVLFLPQTGTPVGRTGADEWLRDGLTRTGVGPAWVSPLAVVGVLGFGALRRWKSRPGRMASTLFGMTLESLVFAVALWAGAKNLAPAFAGWGVPAAVGFAAPAAGQLVTYVGAGIYEEVLFRLGLFGGLCLVLRLALLPKIVAVPLAAVGAALVFAGAHHYGAAGEPFVPGRFLFRALAGLYFTAVFVTRGFGVTAGTHAAYDVLVGVAVG